MRILLKLIEKYQRKRYHNQPQWDKLKTISINLDRKKKLSCQLNHLQITNSSLSKALELKIQMLDHQEAVSLASLVEIKLEGPQWLNKWVTKSKVVASLVPLKSLIFQITWDQELKLKRISLKLSKSLMSHLWLLTTLQNCRYWLNKLQKIVINSSQSTTRNNQKFLWSTLKILNKVTNQKNHRLRKKNTKFVRLNKMMMMTLKCQKELFHLVTKESSKDKDPIVLQISGWNSHLLLSALQVSHLKHFRKRKNLLLLKRSCFKNFKRKIMKSMNMKAKKRANTYRQKQIYKRTILSHHLKIRH